MLARLSGSEAGCPDGTEPSDGRSNPDHGEQKEVAFRPAKELKEAV
jgi:hypothetical protein